MKLVCRDLPVHVSADDEVPGRVIEKKNRDW